MEYPQPDTPSSDETEPPALTLLETHVLTLLWQGQPQAAIARVINRSPRTVRRITQQLSAKLTPFHPHLLCLRLEEELLARIPDMNDAALLAALRLYLPISRPGNPAPPTPVSNRDVQSLLQEVMRHDDADAAATG